jgi:hypothetical protein
MKTLLVAALVAAFVPTAFGQIVNGGFETDPLLSTTVTGWTVDAGTFQVTNFEPHGGHQSLHQINPITGSNATGPVPDTINMHQIVTTTVGQNYTLTLWDWAFDPFWDPVSQTYTLGNPIGGIQLHYQWNGVDLFNAAPIDPEADPTTVGSGWHSMSFNVLGTGSDRLDIKSAKTRGSLFFDDVSMTAVPEPTTIAVFGIGALAVIRRRRRTK